jgi:hypothetical protein
MVLAIFDDTLIWFEYKERATTPDQATRHTIFATRPMYLGAGGWSNRQAVCFRFGAATVILG